MNEHKVIITALGDSKTEGVGDTPGGGGYVTRLEWLVNGIRPGSRVLRLGKMGWGSDELITQGLPAVVESQPDIALVWIGSNDLWANYEPEQATSDLARYTTNLDILLHVLHSIGARIYIAQLDDQAQRPMVTQDPEWTTEERAHLSERVAGYNSAIAAKAAEYGATLVDFFHTSLFTNPATLADDGNHPNASGYDQIAQIWFDALQPLLST